jgi:hypothetical protein
MSRPESRPSDATEKTSIALGAGSFAVNFALLGAALILFPALFAPESDRLVGDLIAGLLWTARAFSLVALPASAIGAALGLYSLSRENHTSRGVIGLVSNCLAAGFAALVLWGITEHSR